MNKKIVLIFLSCLVISCASVPKIETDVDNSYNLSQYKSFSIEQSELNESPSQIGLNPILLQRVERAIKSALNNRGLSESQDPDFIVKFLIGTNRETERSTDFGGNFYYDRYSVNRSQQYHKTDKTEVSIRFHDKKTNDVIWYAFSRFNKSNKTQDQETIDLLIERAIEDF